MKKRWVAVMSGILMIALCLPVEQRAEAQSSQSGNLDFTAYKVLLVVGIVVVAAGVVVLVVYKSAGKKTISGCVNPDGAGLALTDDKDKQVYALGGDTAGLKAGERMRLRVKEMHSAYAGKAALWGTKKIVKDMGPCQP